MKPNSLFPLLITGPLTLAALDNIADELIAAAEIAELASAYAFLKTTGETFTTLGLRGSFYFEESDDDGELYALTFRPADLDAAQARAFEEWSKDNNALRDLADAMTNAGHGEFFSLHGKFETFHAEFVKPVEKRLVAAGVVIPSV